ncbi:MAG: DNA double-strand break repair nuclease NurA [Crenarchaeota archaeon]|nr:DNA double-strand break repair nuclease NurA [Thermoproteota archaeon]
MIDKYTANYLTKAKVYIKKILEQENSLIRDFKLCPEGQQLYDLPEPKPVSGHAAVDGGNQSLQLEDFTFFAVRAWAYIHEKGSGQGGAFVGIVVPPHHTDYRISIYREILEAASLVGNGISSTRNLAEEADLVLFDGNIRNSIRWWSPGAVRWENGEQPDLINDLERAADNIWNLYKSGLRLDTFSDLNCDGRNDCIVEFITNPSRRPRTPEFIMELAMRGYDKGLFKDSKWITALEVVEKLYLYKEAIESTWKNGGYPIFLSKSSTSTRLCKEKHSDIFYLRRIHGRNLKPGYIVWSESVQCGAYEITRLVTRKEKQIVPGDICAGRKEPRQKYRFYPRLLGLYEFYVERLGSIEFYVRLSKAGPFMNANLAFDMNIGLKDEDEVRAMVEEALARLASVPMTHGYPLSLMIAHQHARILPEEVLALARGAGLEFEIDPRLKVRSRSRW